MLILLRKPSSRFQLWNTGSNKSFFRARTKPRPCRQFCWSTTQWSKSARPHYCRREGLQQARAAISHYQPQTGQAIARIYFLFQLLPVMTIQGSIKWTVNLHPGRLETHFWAHKAALLAVGSYQLRTPIQFFFAGMQAPSTEGLRYVRSTHSINMI